MERVSAGRAAQCRPCGCPPHRQPPLTPKHSPELMGRGEGSAPLPGGVWGCLAFLPPQQGAGLAAPPRAPLQKGGRRVSPSPPSFAPSPPQPRQRRAGAGGGSLSPSSLENGGRRSCTHARGGGVLSLASRPAAAPLPQWLALPRRGALSLVMLSSEDRFSRSPDCGGGGLLPAPSPISW